MFLKLLPHKIHFQNCCLEKWFLKIRCILYIFLSKFWKIVPLTKTFSKLFPQKLLFLNCSLKKTFFRNCSLKKYIFKNAPLKNNYFQKKAFLKFLLQNKLKIALSKHFCKVYPQNFHFFNNFFTKTTFLKLLLPIIRKKF